MTVTFPSRVDSVLREAQLAGVAEMAAYLQAHLGQALTAYMLGLRERRTVGRWKAGAYEPTAFRALQLQNAYVSFRVLAELAGSPAFAKSWMTGMNSSLGYEAPLDVIRASEHEVSQEAKQAALRSVLRAAVATASEFEEPH
jgi:hypothetical protein